MLDDPDRYWKVKELSEKTGKGLGTVSNVKSFLRDKDWLEERDKDFKLKSINELLHEWSRDYHKSDSIVKEYEDLKKATDYSEGQRLAAYSVLGEIVNLLSEYSDNLRIIGGWVPSLLYPDQEHIFHMQSGDKGNRRRP